MPVLRPDEVGVPSLRRQKQLRLVERIRLSFARNVDVKGNPAPIAFPRGAIEAALVSPDDRPVEECIKHLPIPGSHYPRNPFPQNVAGDKKGKKGSKKK
jgi:hypothetical protein